MAKYKVGDKVRIVSKQPDAFAWASMMNKYLGEVMTVRKVVVDGVYKMEEDLLDEAPRKALLSVGLTFDGWTWAERWISGLAEEPKEPQEIPTGPYSVHIRFCGALTVAELMKGGKVVKVANARCNPDDTYNRGEGAKVAVNRLFEKKQKSVEESVNPVKLWNVGDKFQVVCGNQFFQAGDIVTLVEKYSDGIHRYRGAGRGTHHMAGFRVAPYKEAKK